MGIDLIDQELLENEERTLIYQGVRRMFELYKPDKSEYVASALAEYKKTGVHKLKQLHEENREKKGLQELIANCNEVLATLDKKEQSSQQEKTEKEETIKAKRRKRGMVEILEKSDISDSRSNRSGFQVKHKPIEKSEKRLKEVESPKLGRKADSKGSKK